MSMYVCTHTQIHTPQQTSSTPDKGASLTFHTNKYFLFSTYFAIPISGGWNDNKWVPLEELLAIKGNREPQYTTPVSLAKLKQITPTSIAYYEANENNLFIITILIHLFDHHWHPGFMASITSFPVGKYSRKWMNYQGQLDMVVT